MYNAVDTRGLAYLRLYLKKQAFLVQSCFLKLSYSKSLTPSTSKDIIFPIPFNPLPKKNAKSAKLANEKLTKALNTSFKSEHKEILRQLDDLRDDAFRALRDAINACLRRLNESDNMHAQKLVAIFETHGWTLYDDPYAVESSKLNSLINDLETAESQASLTAIGLMEWFNELKQAQDDFEEAFQQKANDDTKKDFVATSETRPEITENLGELLKQIELDAKYSETPEDYTELLKTINTIIEESSNPARARKTRKQNKIKE